MSRYEKPVPRQTWRLVFLAWQFVASIIKVGTGRGIGLMFVISAIFLLITSLIVFTSPRVRNLEEEIPDAIPE